MGECVPGGTDGRWPSTSICGAYGECVGLTYSYGVSGPSAVCECQSPWSSHGDFLSAPYAYCHIHQPAILALWCLSMVLIWAVSLVYIRAVLLYLKIRRQADSAASNNSGQRRLADHDDPRSGKSTHSNHHTVAHGADHGTHPISRSKPWKERLKDILTNPTRRTLFMIGFILLFFALLCLVKIIGLIRNLDGKSPDNGALIGYDYVATIFYCFAMLSFLETGHSSSTIWLVSAAAFYPPTEAARLRAGFNTALWSVVIYDICTYLLCIAILIMTHVAEPNTLSPSQWTAVEILLLIHFVFKGFAPFACLLPDKRLALMVVENMKQHQNRTAQMKTRMAEQMQVQQTKVAGMASAIVKSKHVVPYNSNPGVTTSPIELVSRPPALRINRMTNSDLQPIELPGQTNQLSPISQGPTREHSPGAGEDAPRAFSFPPPSSTPTTPAHDDKTNGVIITPRPDQALTPIPSDDDHDSDDRVHSILPMPDSARQPTDQVELINPRHEKNSSSISELPIAAVTNTNLNGTNGQLVVSTASPIVTPAATPTAAATAATTVGPHRPPIIHRPIPLRTPTNNRVASMTATGSPPQRALTPQGAGSPAPHQSTMKSQSTAQTEHQERIDEFVARLFKHTKHATVLAIAYIVINCIFAFLPLLRSLVAYFIPIQLIFALITMKNLLHTLTPQDQPNSSTTTTAVSTGAPSSKVSSGGGSGQDLDAAEPAIETHITSAGRSVPAMSLSVGGQSTLHPLNGVAHGHADHSPLTAPTTHLLEVPHSSHDPTTHPHLPISTNTLVGDELTIPLPNLSSSSHNGHQPTADRTTVELTDL